MEKLKKLIAHFKGYQRQAGKEHSVEVDIKKIPMIRKAAEEDAKNTPKEPAKVPIKTDEKPEGKDKTPEGISVIEKVDDLDKFVKKIIDREVETTIKRVIEETVRKELGKPLTQLEQGVRQDVQTEVLDQAQNVERDIKKIAPNAPAAPVKEEKPVAPPAPAKASRSISWTRKAERLCVQIFDNVFIRACADDPSRGEVLFSDESGSSLMTDIRVVMHPELSIGQQQEAYITELNQKV